MRLQRIKSDQSSTPIVFILSLYSYILIATVTFTFPTTRDHVYQRSDAL